MRYLFAQSAIIYFLVTPSFWRGLLRKTFIGRKCVSAGKKLYKNNAVLNFPDFLAGKNFFLGNLGSTNPVNVVRATINALSKMESPESVAMRRGKTVEQIS